MKSRTTFLEDIKMFSKTRVLTISAMLTAISVVIGIICRYYLTFGYYRVTFENLPIIFSGILFGPFVGAIVGLCSDTVSCLVSPNPNINPIISLGALLVGLTSGYISHHVTFKNETMKLIMSVAFAHLIGQVVVKSIGKIIWYNMPWWIMLVGLGISLIVGTLEFFAIKILLKNHGIRKEIDKIR